MLRFQTKHCTDGLTRARKGYSRRIGCWYSGTTWPHQTTCRYLFAVGNHDKNVFLKKSNVVEYFFKKAHVGACTTIQSPSSLHSIWYREYLVFRFFFHSLILPTIFLLVAESIICKEILPFFLPFLLQRKSRHFVITFRATSLFSFRIILSNSRCIISLSEKKLCLACFWWFCLFGDISRTNSRARSPTFCLGWFHRNRIHRHACFIKIEKLIYHVSALLHLELMQLSLHLYSVVITLEGKKVF